MEWRSVAAAPDTSVKAGAGVAPPGSDERTTPPPSAPPPSEEDMVVNDIDA